MRHQEGDEFTNCLSAVGVNHSQKIARQLRTIRHMRVYTLLPYHNGKHIRPMQTATAVCSELGLSLSILNDDDVFPRSEGDAVHLIIWHHSGIPNILRKYFPDASFVWTTDNYSGCLMVYEKYWTYVSDFFVTSSKKGVVNRFKAWWIRYIKR